MHSTSVSQPCSSTVLRLAGSIRQSVQQVQRHAEQVQEHAANHVAVADGGQFCVRVAGGEGSARRRRRGFARPASFQPAGRLPKAAAGIPGGPGGIAVKLGEGAAAPGAEINLDQQRFSLHGQAARRGDGLCGLQGAAHRTAEHRGEARGGEALAPAARLVTAAHHRALGQNGQQGCGRSGRNARGGSGGCGSSSKRFFFEKKNQKTCDSMSALSRCGTRQRQEKFFASFFQKRSLFPSLVTPARRR